MLDILRNTCLAVIFPVSQLHSSDIVMIAIIIYSLLSKWYFSLLCHVRCLKIATLITLKFEIYQWYSASYCRKNSEQSCAYFFYRAHYISFYSLNAFTWLLGLSVFYFSRKLLEMKDICKQIIR